MYSVSAIIIIIADRRYINNISEQTMALRTMYCSTRVAEHWYMANAFYGFFLYMDFDLFILFRCDK